MLAAVERHSDAIDDALSKPDQTGSGIRVAGFQVANDHEFIAAASVDIVTTADSGRDPTTHKGNHLVADRMAERVVDRLELIKVDEQCTWMAGVVADSVVERCSISPTSRCISMGCNFQLSTMMRLFKYEESETRCFAEMRLMIRAHTRRSPPPHDEHGSNFA